MTTHHTRYGDLNIDTLSPFTYRVQSDQLHLNGKPYELQTTQVQVLRHGWSTDTTWTLQRLDHTRKPTARTRAKADRIVLDAAQTAASAAGISDQQVAAHRWQAELDATMHALNDQQARLDHYVEQVRVAECHVLAHHLDGAAGEIARTLCSDGWQRSPQELEEAVKGLTA